MSLLDRGYDDEEDIKDAVLSYCSRGAVSASQNKRSSDLTAPAKGGMFQMQFSQQQQEQQTSQNEAQNELFDVRFLYF